MDEPPEQIVKNGKAKFGTYKGVSSKLDIKGMRAPYAGVPMPAFLSKLRIKSRLIYSFNLGQYIGFTKFFDFKVFGIVQATFWNMETEKSFAYHAIMPARRRFVPTNTSSAIAACYQNSRQVILFWEDNHNFIKCEFRLKGDRVRPSAKGKMISVRNDSMHTDLMFVNPAPTSSRCTATWLSAMSIKGSLHTYTKDKIPEHKIEDGIATMNLSRAYYKSHTAYEMAEGLGVVQNKKLVFNLAYTNIDASDADKYNSNVLIIDGKATPLPSVVITHPFGTSKTWIIQDTESMVDLTFTPVSIKHRVTNVIVSRTEQTAIYGTYEGVLATKDGEKIYLKKFPGLVFKNIVRT